MSGHNSDEESNQNVQSNDSSDEVSAASNRILALMLDSPRDNVHSTHSDSVSTVTTSLTSNTRSSSSVECVSGGSNTIDSRIESIGNTDESRVQSIANSPLDEGNPIQDIPRRASEEVKAPVEPRPEPEGASKPDVLPSVIAGSATGSLGDQNKPLPDPVEKKPGSKLEVEEPKVQNESQLEPELLSGVPQISVLDDRTSSAPHTSAENVEQSRAGSSDKVDYDESCISQSEYSADAETDRDADVSNISAMPSEKKRKVYRSKKPQPKTAPKLADVIADYFEDNPLGSSADLASRADTLDDADALRLDSVSVRSSIPDLGAAVLFPDEVNFPDVPDRSRRAISLPAEPAKKVTRIPHDSRRAISEAPDDSKLQSEIPPLSASPDDVPLPSNLVSSSSSSSGRHVSDLDLDACEKAKTSEQTDQSQESRELETALSRTLRQGDDTSSVPPESEPSGLESSEKSSGLQGSNQGEQPDLGVTGRSQAAALTDTSFTESGDVAQLQALQGWMNQGKGQSEKRELSRLPPRPAVVPSDSSFTESCDAANLQALQGWVNQGRDQGEKREGPPRLPTLPVTEKRRVVLSDSTSTRSSDEAHFTALKAWVRQGRLQGSKPLSVEQPGPSTVPDVTVSGKCEETVEDDLKVQESSKSASADDPEEGTSSDQQRKIKEIVEAGVQTDEKHGDSKTIKRKRRDKKQLQLRLSIKTKGSDSSDQPSQVESPEEGLASKKYCSEFHRPVLARRLNRSNSTGSVKDEHKHRRNFREWQESVAKESPEKDSEDEESSTSKKPKEDKDEEDNS